MKIKKELITYREFLYELIEELKTLKEKIDKDYIIDYEDIIITVIGKLNEAEEEVSDLIGEVSVQIYFIEK